jgi:hypothetical protein
MGLNASGDEYCRRGDRALAGVQGVLKIVDDILVFASTPEELISRTRDVLQRCSASGITLSRSKAKAGTSVKFAGFIVTSSGISPDPMKTDSISKFPAPKNITDLRSFMGLANQLGHFVPDMAHAAEPLRHLLKKKNEFLWLDDHQNAFQKVKDILTSPDGPVLAHFNPSLPTALLTDASRLKGIGFALLQTYPNGSTRLIQCGSRFLSSAETRYAVCELEALAIQWAVIRCKVFLLGISFTVLTDHKPLVGIFNGKNMDAVENARLQRILEKLAGYTFDVKWTPGKDHMIADALSRNPVFDPPEDQVASVATMAITSLDPALAPLAKTAKNDLNYQSIISTLLQNSNLKSLPECHPARPFSKVWNDLSLDETSGLLLLHANRVVVPTACRRGVLEKLHLPHQGIRRTRENARYLYYWPGMNNDISNLVNSCPKCTELQPSLPSEPLLYTTASRPFESISVDLFKCSGKDYIVAVDRFSGWPLVAPLCRLSTDEIIYILSDWFIDYGIPENIRSDGGPQFRSAFSKFCTENNITHELSSPYHSPSNGHAESAVKSMKHLISKSKDWPSFRKSLLEWRNVPRTDGLSPAQWLFGRRLRTFTPASSAVYSRVSDAEFKNAVEKKKKVINTQEGYFNVKCKNLPKLSVGADVLIQDPQSKLWNSRGKIAAIRENKRSYLVSVNGRNFVRNRKFIRPLLVTSDGDDDESKQESTEITPNLRRSQRKKNKPKRY